MHPLLVQFSVYPSKPYLAAVSFLGFIAAWTFCNAIPLFQDKAIGFRLNYLCIKLNKYQWKPISWPLLGRGRGIFCCFKTRFNASCVYYAEL